MSLISSRAGDRIVRAARKVTGIGLLPRQPVFLHIPKTAGTSLRRMMDKAFWGQPALNVPSTGPRRERIERMSQQQFDRYAIYRGHFLPEFATRVRNPFLFTFLREPQDRLLSHYYYYYHQPDGTGLPIQAFLEDPARSDNMITRALAGEARAAVAIEALAAMDFIGFTEDFEHDVGLVLRMLGREGVVEERTKVTPTRAALDDLPSGVRAALEERTSEDRKVYEWAIANRQKSAA
jgi:hypothetical protein